MALLKDNFRERITITTYCTCPRCGFAEVPVHTTADVGPDDCESRLEEYITDFLEDETDWGWDAVTGEWLCPDCLAEVIEEEEAAARDVEATEDELMSWGRI